MAVNFDRNLPPFDLEHDYLVFVEVLRNPSFLLRGLPYSCTLLAILLAHEMGHYLACVYYRIRASLPYFIPVPIGIGTFGAFIRFHSAVKSRRELFDVGIAGPLAGFLFVIPAAGIGMSLSKAVPGIGAHGDIMFGTPMLIRMLELFLFPGVPAEDIYLHPVARGAWVGLLATALNLLPVGQLDGGHLAYARFGRLHRYIALATIAALAMLGFIHWPWWVWSAILLIVGRSHFLVFDESPLGRGRTILLALAVLIFALSFIPAPVQYNQ